MLIKMGIIFSSPAEDKPKKKKPESVINISENCVEKLTTEENESGKQSPAEALNIPHNVSEKDWIMKLKCLDDAHSNTYGLTVQAFYKLAEEVDSNIEAVRPNLCNAEEVIECLKKKCCSIKCRLHMEKYIDCVDSFRINIIIKEQIECEMKKKKKKEAKTVESFLKSE